MSRSVVALLLILLAGCSPNDLVLTQVVGPDGAELALPGGAAITIPAGALTEDVEIGIELLLDLEDAGYAAAPSVFAAVPDASVALTPHGQTFALPVTLTLPTTSPPADLVLMRVDDASDTEWEPIGGLTIGDGRLTAALDRFSVLSAGAANGTCDCWTGAELDAMAAAIPSVAATWGAASAPTGGVNGNDGSYSRSFPTVSGEITLRASSVSSWSFDEQNGIWVEDGLATGCSISVTGPDPRTNWDLLFPSRPPGWETITTSSYVGEYVTGSACVPLLGRFVASTSEHAVSAQVSGLPAGASLTLSIPELSVTETLSQDGPRSLGSAAPGTAVTVTVSQQPAGATCSPAPAAVTIDAPLDILVTCVPAAEVCNGVDDDGDGSVDEGFDADADGVTTCGPDGVPDNADDDCNDGDATVHPGADEVCDGIDNDCDEAPVTGETTDGDGDGVPDDCDANPATSCASFDLADADEVLALAGALCFVDAGVGTMPTALSDLGLTTWTGVFKDWGDDAIELLGAGIDSSVGEVAPAGCLPEGTTDPCGDNGRPYLPVESTVDAEQYGACYDVAAYACR